MEGSVREPRPGSHAAGDGAGEDLEGCWQPQRAVGWQGCGESRGQAESTAGRVWQRVVQGSGGGGG